MKTYGRYVPVRAEVVNATDFSVHADCDELLAWVASAEQPPEAVYVVHGENGASATLARRITDELGLIAVVPWLGEQLGGSSPPAAGAPALVVLIVPPAVAAWCGRSAERLGHPGGRDLYVIAIVVTAVSVALNLAPVLVVWGLHP